MLTPAEAWEWPFIAATIAPAVEADGTPSLDEVLNQIERGTMQAWHIGDGAAGYAVTQTAYVQGDDGKDTETVALWPVYVGGKVFRSPRATMKRIAAELEAKAREIHCDEMRVTGDRALQWASVLTGFERCGNGLRKVLHYDKE